jgi:hypothetical protein
MRSAEEISDQREIAEFCLWRARRPPRQRFPGEEFSKNEKSMETLRASADHAAATGEARGFFKRINGDFPAFGKAFRDLSDDELNHITSISMERWHGLNWLCAIEDSLGTMSRRTPKQAHGILLCFATRQRTVLHAESRFCQPGMPEEPRG